MKYDKDAKCKKCGFDVVTARYIGSLPVYCGGSQNGNTPEFIQRRCANCGYTWREEPITS